MGNIGGVHGEGRYGAWSWYGLWVKQGWFIWKVLTSIRPIRKLTTTIFILLDIYWLPLVIWYMLNIYTDSRALKPGNWGAKFFREVLSNKFLLIAFFWSSYFPVQTWKTPNSCGFLFCWICVGEKCTTLNSEWSPVWKVVVFSCAISNALIGIFKDFPHIRLLTQALE